MTTLERAIRSAIPLVEAQTGAKFVVQRVFVTRAIVDIFIGDGQYETEPWFTLQELADDDLEGCVYEVLLSTVEAIVNDQLGSVS